MKVVWSDEAVYALIALDMELADRYSAEIVETMISRIERLEDHAQLGRAVPEYSHSQLRELVDSWNRVLYRLRPDAIEIVTIVPARIPLDIADPEND